MDERFTYLRSDFFEQRKIRELEKGPDGARNLLSYINLKIQTLDGTRPVNALDTDIKETALKKMVKLGLISFDQFGNILITHKEN